MKKKVLLIVMIAALVGGCAGAGDTYTAERTLGGGVVGGGSG